MMITVADLDRWLGEDVPFGDLTTHALGIAERAARMEFRARGPMVVAAIEQAAQMIERRGAAVIRHTQSGQEVTAGRILLEAEGEAGVLLATWKVAQTLVEYASGVASRTRAMVRAAKAVDARAVVACTRKSWPGTRAVCAAAVLAGGGVMHRLGLSETILVFPEHLSFLGDQPLDRVIGDLIAACPERMVVVEVTDPDQAIAAARAGAGVVQLEKFSPDQVALVSAALHSLSLGARMAAAGGINEDNAADYVRAGAQILVTSAPYQAVPRDVSVQIGPR